MASVVYNEEVVGPCVFEKGRHLDAELDAWVWDGGDLPALRAEAVLLLHDLLYRGNVLVYCPILFPA